LNFLVFILPRVIRDKDVLLNEYVDEINEKKIFAESLSIKKNYAEIKFSRRLGHLSNGVNLNECSANSDGFYIFYIHGMLDKDNSILFNTSSSPVTIGPFCFRSCTGAPPSTDEEDKNKPLQLAETSARPEIVRNQEAKSLLSFFEASDEREKLQFKAADPIISQNLSSAASFTSRSQLASQLSSLSSSPTLVTSPLTTSTLPITTPEETTFKTSQATTATLSQTQISFSISPTTTSVVSTTVSTTTSTVARNVSSSTGQTTTHPIPTSSILPQTTPAPNECHFFSWQTLNTLGQAFKYDILYDLSTDRIDFNVYIAHLANNVLLGLFISSDTSPSELNLAVVNQSSQQL
jgi:hypothetical protein